MPTLKPWSERRKEAQSGSKEFTPLEDGPYTFVIKDQPKHSDNNGNDSFSIRATVEDGPRKNASIIHYFNYNDNAWAAQNFFFEPLAALGLDGNFFDSNPNEDQIIRALHGKRFTAEVFVDEYNGNKRKKLKNFAPASGPAPQSGVPSATPAAAPAAPSPVAPAPEATPANPPTAQAETATAAPAEAPPQQAPPAPAAPAQEQPQATPQTESPWGNSAPPPPPAL